VGIAKKLIVNDKKASKSYQTKVPDYGDKPKYGTSLDGILLWWDNALHCQWEVAQAEFDLVT